MAPECRSHQLRRHHGATSGSRSARFQRRGTVPDSRSRCGRSAEREPVPERIDDGHEAYATLGPLVAPFSSGRLDLRQCSVQVADVEAQPALTVLTNAARVSAMVASRQRSSLQNGDSNSTVSPMTSR